jgi:hypothetical protein
MISLSILARFPLGRAHVKQYNVKIVDHRSKKGASIASHDFEPPRLNIAPLPMLMQPHQ